MSREPRTKVPEALAPYQRPKPLPRKSGRNKPAKSAKVPYVRALRSALARLEKEAMAALTFRDAGALAATFSVSSVVAAAGLGRSQIYNAYPEVRVAIAAAKARVLEAHRNLRASRPKTKTELQREVRQVKKELKRSVAAAASTQLTALIAKLGPEFRRREVLTAQIAELRKRLAEAEQAKQALAEQNRSWMVELNRRLQRGGEPK